MSKRKVVHKSLVRETLRFGVKCTVTSTLCGRMDNSNDDGMNSGEDPEVTCKFCLRIMERRQDA